MPREISGICLFVFSHPIINGEWLWLFTDYAWLWTNIGISVVQFKRQIFYYPLRDIQPGQEVLTYYGPEFMQALQQQGPRRHVDVETAGELCFCGRTTGS